MKRLNYHIYPGLIFILLIANILSFSSNLKQKTYPWDEIDKYKQRCEKFINYHNSKLENEENHFTNFYRLNVNRKDIKWHFLISTNNKEVIKKIEDYPRCG